MKGLFNFGSSRRHVQPVLIAALMLYASCCVADDDWTGGDKRAHFIGGAIVGGVVSASTGSRGPGILTGCAVGVFGELIEAGIDRDFSPRVSAKDFAAECAGGVVGAFAGAALGRSRRDPSAPAFNERWVAGDKLAHFAGSMALSTLVANATDSATAGVLVGCGQAVGGELIDAARHGWRSRHVSVKDFAAGCLGAVTGALVSVQIAPNRIVWTRKF